MTDPLEPRFDGLDGARPVPPDLLASLEGLLTGADPAALLARTGTDDPRPLPAGMGERTAGALAAAKTRRPLLRLVTGGAQPAVFRAVAVALAVLLVAATAAVGAEMSRRRSGPAAIDPLLPPRSVPTTAAPAEPAPSTTVAPPPPRQLVALQDCDELLGHFKDNALALVGRGQWVPWQTTSDVVAMDFSTAGAAAGGRTAGAQADGSPPVSAAPAPVEASGTNVQEAGVDEPDIVKTEAGRVFTVAADTRGPVIRSLRPRPGAADLLDTFDLPPEAAGAQLLLSGNRLLALATAWDHEVGGTWTKIWVLDVGDPAAMKLTDVVALEGSYTTARLANGLVRVVISSAGAGPEVAFPPGGTPDYEARLRSAAEAAVRESSLDDWVTNYVHERHRGGGAPTVSTGRACACDDTLRPLEFSGFGSVTVLTIDPLDPKPDNVASVTGAAHVTYASATDLFVSSAAYASPIASTSARRDAIAPRLPHETSIHQFSIEQQQARYVASGKVPGVLLNQFSMSQHEGHLRVASTLHDSQRENGIDNVVTILRRDGDALEVAGWVAGLGAPGERIHGVRMMGDTGYVVTFRQIDPLYVLDLSDPARPRVTGELKIPGVSTYLHPIGSDRLIGIGAEATAEGRRTGVGLSVFDVSKRDSPTRAAHLPLGPGQSPAEHDHHAFLYWPRSSTVVVPYQSFGDADGQHRLDFSAVVVDATPSSLTERGRVSHLGRDDASTRSGHEGLATIQRSAVIGGDLWTFSAVGVLINDLESLDERAWVGYFGG